MPMSRYSGVIKLFSNKRMINRSVYFNREDRDNILDRWSKWYGIKFKKCRIQIDPNLSLEEDKIMLDISLALEVQKELKEHRLLMEEARRKEEEEIIPDPPATNQRPPAIYDNQKSIYGVEKYW